MTNVIIGIIILSPSPFYYENDLLKNQEKEEMKLKTYLKGEINKQGK